MNINKSPDRKIDIRQNQVLYFGGTAYLGLQTNLEFQEIVCKNIKIWGTSCGSSRLANVSLKAYEECENFLSTFIKSEAAVTVSSGMLAGKIVIDEIKKSGTAFYHFNKNHAAILVENSMPFYVDNQLNSRLTDNRNEKIAIVCDAVLSGTVQPFDQSILDKISISKNITLVLDESHSLGILGQNGYGLFSAINHKKINQKIIIVSLGKALGVTAGIIASDKNFIDSIFQNKIFATSASMNTAFAASLPEAKMLIERQHKKLQKNLLYIKDNLIANTLYDFNENYPLIYPNIDNINKLFQKKKYRNHVF
jgi:7-keto-8-aminopelargonate synthetase-like enzyme